MRFEIGDRVEVISKQGHFNTVGLLGTVLFVDDECSSRVGVEHDCEFDRGDDLRCMCRQGYGLCYYDAKRQLLLITDDECAIEADGLEDLL